MTKAVISAMVRPLVEPHLPDGINVEWIGDRETAESAIADADIAWVDMNDPQAMRAVILAGEKLKWLSTIYAGLDHFPVAELAARGTSVTNGVGISAVAVAEYAVMGMLSLAKNYPEVMRSADRREWLNSAPGTIELEGSRALIVGYGAIGRAIGTRIAAFGVDVTGVARTARPAENILGASDWKHRIAEYDWIVLAMPSTAETEAVLGETEIAAMKREAFIINVARGDCIDQDALVAALQRNTIGGAFLDVVTPEPLPDDSPLWGLANCQLSMHLSGRSQRGMFQKSSQLFLRNLDRFLAGDRLENLVDLSLGY